jgi:hypothetical protein
LLFIQPLLLFIQPLLLPLRLLIKNLFHLAISLVFFSCSRPSSYFFLLYCTVDPSSLDHRQVFISDLSFLLSSFFCQFVSLLSSFEEMDRIRVYMNVKL